jgi:acyl dehydratase
MAVNSKHILSQGAVLSGMGRLMLASLAKRPSSLPVLPTEPLHASLKPRSKDLVRDYVKAVGGDPKNYRDVLPPHMFPQWGFGLAARTLMDIPYPIAQVVNGGCRIEVLKPIPANETLQVSAQLMSVDDNGRRVLLDQRIVTSTESAGDVLIAHLFPLIPLKSKSGSKKKSEKPRVPLDVQELRFGRIPSGAGLDFAKLTGDFNPIHWIAPYAKLSGFKNTILHGFATMARAMEAINQLRVPVGHYVSKFDVEFRRPLVLPAKVGIYTDGKDGVYVGDAPGGPAYMEGTFELKAYDGEV